MVKHMLLPAGIHFIHQKAKIHTQRIKVSRPNASQSSVSQYLAKMKSEKILSAKRDGKSIRYSLTNKEIKKLIEKMKDIF